MIFVEHVTIPANTPASSPVEVDLPVILGTITLVSVQFPPGVNALAHATISWGLYQLFPSNQDAAFSTGGETIAWDEEFLLDAEPALLKLQGWNEDTVYDHTITVRIVMQPAAAAPLTSAAVLESLQQQSSQEGGS